MTKKYDIDGFNEQTYDDLIDKQEKAGEGLTPDNFDNIDFDYVDSDNLDKIEYLPEAIVNGVDIGKLYEVINYMNLNKTQLNSIVEETIILSEKTTINIEIPDSYDGRNSFVMVSFNHYDDYSGTPTFFNQRTFKEVVNRVFINRNGGGEPYNLGYNIIKNKREVSVNFDGLNNTIINYMNDSCKYVSAKILVLLWRLK